MGHDGEAARGGSWTPPAARATVRRTGSGFDWTAYFRELEARVVHMRRTVRRRLQRMRQSWDRILPTPEDAAVLRGVVRLVRELPLWGG